MIFVEPRAVTRWYHEWLAVLVALILTLLTVSVLLAAIGLDPLSSLHRIFIKPLNSVYGISELLAKATPLITIGVALALGFRAGVWNIGAEGQLVMGGLCGGAVALAFWGVDGFWVMPLVLLGGTIGGLFWGAIPAFLKVRFNANEILVSLMLTYVAILLLSVMVHGPLRDPDGFNFPESRLFHDAATLPKLFSAGRGHLGFVFAIAFAIVGTWVVKRWHLGFEMRVTGLSASAAKFAGYSRDRTVWMALLMGGAISGFAGVVEVTGNIGQLVPTISPSYGFTAIIVAFLARLHPLAVIPAGLLVALSYLAGEAAQLSLGVPAASTQVFQGLLLFFLLGTSMFVNYRVRLGQVA
ncbi:MAG: ABC transporter permease [Proteobacteria bacterium]|nr:ABC transporter permease [Pseudomonadota bacterium]